VIGLFGISRILLTMVERQALRAHPSNPRRQARPEMAARVQARLHGRAGQRRGGAHALVRGPDKGGLAGLEIKDKLATTRST